MSRFKQRNRLKLPHIKISPKWVLDLTVKARSKLLRKDVQEVTGDRPTVQVGTGSATDGGQIRQNGKPLLTSTLPETEKAAGR